jgi:hypothetical protein
MAVVFTANALFGTSRPTRERVVKGVFALLILVTYRRVGQVHQAPVTTRKIQLS